MRTLQTIANSTTGNMIEEHTLEIPPCCPVSKNPQLGSTLTIRYRPQGCSLEVGSLFAYVHQFRGGLYDEQGKLVVRDMEGMLLRIAQDCSQALQTQVRLIANLNIVPKQVVRIEVEYDQSNRDG